MHKIGTYVNGNTIVEIFDDGTKIRYAPDDAPAQPDYPESIDMKITNCCDMNCVQCHEMSTSSGKHGNLNSKLIDSLHPYTEVAIGGGDPLSHPKLPELLQKLRDKKVIANITVHWLSFLKNYQTLLSWEKEGLIHGLGVSVNEVISQDMIQKIADFPNSVVHTIIGIAEQNVYKQFFDEGIRILLLGYKTFGRGKEFKDSNALNIKINTNWIKDNILKFTKHFEAVSFDNLAITQTNLKDVLDRETFDHIYMGDDGSFTMYIDLVENKYAVSSVSERHDIFSDYIEDLFAKLKE